MPPTIRKQRIPHHSRRAFTPHLGGWGGYWRNFKLTNLVQRAWRVLLRALRPSHRSSAIAAQPPRGSYQHWPDHDIQSPTSDAWRPRRRTHGN